VQDSYDLARARSKVDTRKNVVFWKTAHSRALVK
jgi:hypothetical protein